MNENKNSWNAKRVIALVGVIAFAVMIIATLVTAITGSVYFMGCLIVTIALPLTLWVFLWSYGVMMNKHTIASFDLGATGEENTEEEQK